MSFDKRFLFLFGIMLFFLSFSFAQNIAKCKFGSTIPKKGCDIYFGSEKAVNFADSILRTSPDLCISFGKKYYVCGITYHFDIYEGTIGFWASAFKWKDDTTVDITPSIDPNFGVYVQDGSCLKKIDYANIAFKTQRHYFDRDTSTNETEKYTIGAEVDLDKDKILKRDIDFSLTWYGTGNGYKGKLEFVPPGDTKTICKVQCALTEENPMDKQHSDYYCSSEEETNYFKKGVSVKEVYPKLEKIVGVKEFFVKTPGTSYAIKNSDKYYKCVDSQNEPILFVKKQTNGYIVCITKKEIGTVEGNDGTSTTLSKVDPFDVKKTAKSAETTPNNNKTVTTTKITPNQQFWQKFFTTMYKGIFGIN